jgi:hypothetical protein
MAPDLRDNLYIEDLVQNWPKEVVSFCTGNTSLNFILFAADQIVRAASVDNLQRII